MAFTYTADSSAPPAAVWALLAEPGQWHRWAPHIRGVRGFGGARVTSPSAGVILLAGVVPVLALITEATATSWTWRIGLVRVRHSITPHGPAARSPSS
ncbi:SRPBCC family protein [Conexibacter sp. DBS9H8]|uniref:SRPBCC family protein n=1 Tax=Conexibacter sp. DBS9H8 TaxID=2937801 RepID=UPI00200DCDE6|nr:SRPBCC family protein [Conexibacter sp. DBS9H8]